MLDERVNCMSYLCDDGTDAVPGVATQNGITHGLARTALGYLFRLCDFDRANVLRPGRWPTERVVRDDESPASPGSPPPG